MKTWAAALGAAMVMAVGLATPAMAAPLTFGFSGTVTSTLDADSVVNSYPIGTAVNLQVTVSDNPYDPGAPQQGTSDGFLQIGGDTVLLSGGYSSELYYLFTSTVQFARLSIPVIGQTAPGGAEFLVLRLYVAPDLSFYDTPSLAFGYDVDDEFGRRNEYLYTEGRQTQVPEPATAWLLLPALAGLALTRRARRRAEAAG